VKNDEIRQKFIDFFVQRGHIHLPSLPLATSDPSITTLFTIAGMQQMIPYFLGREQPPGPNMVTVQKAIRTNDIEEVGDDTHMTYLEMLGNFSVGDYFKREAIRYTWDFLTETMGVPAERWWAVTYPGDDEARQAWLEVGVPADRIGEDPENWWIAGNQGPCGPNSEIHYDRGPEYGCGEPNCRPETACCQRFVEVWNDVFMSWYQEENGERRPLPWKNIDTGMGFERLTAIAQGVPSAYETDLFQPVIRSVTALTGREYGTDRVANRSLRIIADHSRAATFIISDGVMPSAERRGYVLRRLIRRAALHGRLLGIERPFLTYPVQSVIDTMSGYHSELRERTPRILQVIREEETRFLETLNRGLSIFEDVAARAQASGAGISGADAFGLYDTHGFPLEITEELAAERQLAVDRDGFDQALQAQRVRAREHANRRTIGTSPETYVEIARQVPETVFTGYNELRTTTTVAAIVAGGEPVSRVERGAEAEIVLIATPFYAESGGQVGDTGFIRGDGGVARVLGTQRPYASLISHRVRVEDGSIAVDDVVEAEVDTERRLHILPHHSGTHLLHKALQEVLGPEATQAGSLVAPDRLRFDFNWPRPLTQDEINEVQDRVNAAIWANLPVRADVMSFEDAVHDGAMALFGEKYGDRVRVVSIGDWSKELCGGTHVNATGDIGLLVITREESSSAGVRRIEAVAGAAAYAYLNQLRDRLDQVATTLETAVDNVTPRATQLMAQTRDQEKRIEALTQRLAALEAETLLHQARAVDSMTVVAGRVAADSVEYLKATTDAVKARLDRGIVVLGAVLNGGPRFTMAVTRNLADEGYSAREILGAAAVVAGGKGGGQPEFAQGGGKDPTKVQEVLETAVDIIRRKAEG
jgi:alanyl-tRNA synthetase